MNADDKVHRDIAVKLFNMTEATESFTVSGNISNQEGVIVWGLEYDRQILLLLYKKKYFHIFPAGH